MADDPLAFLASLAQRNQPVPDVGPDEQRANAIAANIKAADQKAAAFNPLVAGLGRGIGELTNSALTGVEAGARAIGADTVADIAAKGASNADRNSARIFERPDLEGGVLDENFRNSPVKYAIYQLSKQIPQWAPQIAAAVATEGATAIPGLARLGAAAPEIIGGGGAGLKALFGGAVSKTALEKGAELGAKGVAATAAGYVPSVGQVYGEAKNSAEATGKPVDENAAIRALAWGVPYAAMEAVEPAGAVGGIMSGGGRGILKRILQGAAFGAGTETVTEGIQTGIEQSERPDLSVKDKLFNVANAALTGGLIGGLFGGGGGAISVNSNAGDNDLKAAVDNIIQPTNAKGQAVVAPGSEQLVPALPAPQAPVLQAGDNPRVQPGPVPTGDGSPDVVGNQVALEKQRREYAAMAAADEASALANGPFPAVDQGTGQQLALPAPRPEPDFFAGNVPGTAAPSIEEAAAATAAKTRPIEDAAGQLGINPELLGPEQLAPRKGEPAPAPLVEDDQTAQQRLLLTPEDRTKSVRETIKQLVPDAKNLGQVKSEDFVGYADALVSKLEAGKTPTKLEMAVAERTGLLQDRATLQAQSEALVQQLQAAPVEQRPAIQGQLRQTVEAIALQDAVQARREAAKAPAAPVQQTAAEPAPKGTPNVKTDTLLGDRLSQAMAKQNVEFAGARTQQSIQQAQAAERAAPDVAVAKAVSESNLANPQNVSANPVQGAAQSKTLEAYNRLVDPEVQQRLLDEAFDGDPAQLESYVSGFKSQKQARSALSELVNRASRGTIQLAEQDWQKVPSPAKQTQAGAAAVRRMEAERDAKATPAPTAAPTVEAAPRATLKGTPAQQAAIARNLERQASAVAPASGVSENVAPAGQAAPAIPAKATPAQVARLQERARAATEKATAAEAQAAPAVRAPQTVSQSASLTDAQQRAVVQRTAREAVASGRLTTQEAMRGVEAMSQGNFDEAMSILSGQQQTPPKATKAGTEKAAAAIEKQGVTKEAAAPTAKAVDKALQEASTPPKGKRIKANTGEMVDEAETGITNLRSLEKPGDFKALPDWFQRTDLVLSKLAAQLGLGRVEFMVGDSTGTGVRGLAFEQGNRIVLDSSLGPVKAMAVALHELGHLIEFKLFDRVDGETQMRIATDYQTYAASVKNPKSFSEWFADQTATWMTTDAQPRTVIDKFFARVAEVWKTLWNEVVNQVPLSMSVADFMRGAWRNELNLAAEGTVLSGDRVYANRDDTILGLNNRSTDLFKLAERTANKLMDAKATKILANRVGLAVSTLGHIVDRFGKEFKSGGLKAVQEVEAFRSSAGERWAGLMMNGFNAVERMGKEKGAADKITKLMSYSQFRIDPRKTWAEHEHLVDDLTVLQKQAAKGDQRAADRLAKAQAKQDMLKAKVQEANTLYNDLKRIGKVNGEDPVAAYGKLVDANRAQYYAAMATELWRAAKAAPGEFKSTDIDPMTQFIEKAEIYNDPTAAAKYWSDKLNELQKDVTDTATALGKDKLSASSALNNLLTLSKKIDVSKVSVEQSPYFHMGRVGRYYVSFNLKTDEKTGQLDQAALDKVFDGMKSLGIDQIEIPREGNPKTFIRFESLGQAQAFRTLVGELQAAGVIDEKPIGSGDRLDDYRGVYGGKEAIDRLEQQLAASGAFAAQEGASEEEVKELSKIRESVMRQVNEAALNMLPDMSVTRVLTKRDNVSGYDKNWLRSYAYRAQVGANALVSLAAHPRSVEALGNMRADIQEAKAGADLEKTVRMQNIFKEVQLRQAQSGTPTNTTISRIRALNHTFFLGLSPAYVVLQYTQLGALSLPELSRKGGFVAAAKAMGRATKDANAVMGAIWGEAKKAGWRKFADIEITEDGLRKALGTSPEAEDKIRLLMNLANRGSLTLGSQTRELGRTSGTFSQNKVDKVLSWASAAGLWAETHSRLITALAANEISKGSFEERADFANYTVQQAMLNYTNGNTARAFGKNGIAGQLTPLGASFMQYNLQVMEKLYREVHTVFSGTAEERKESARFLGGHVAAMFIMAGSLGLPGASLFAGLFNKLKDIFDGDDEPTDIAIAWRNFLSDTFGKDVGEMLARGVTRGVGVDISSRVGEADLLPFTKLISDRRGAKEALKDLVWRSAGAPFSMAGNIVDGAEKMSNGNIIEGMQAMLPLALSNVAKAYSMKDGKYVDSKGNAMPMDASVKDMFVQAFGFNPSKKAEASENDFAQSVRRKLLSTEASNIRTNLAQAYEAGDQASVSKWLERGLKFETANPSYKVVSTIGATISRRATQRATAEALGVTPNTNIKDAGALAISRFMNIQ